MARPAALVASLAAHAALAAAWLAWPRPPPGGGAAPAPAGIAVQVVPPARLAWPGRAAPAAGRDAGAGRARAGRRAAARGRARPSGIAPAPVPGGLRPVAPEPLARDGEALAFAGTAGAAADATEGARLPTGLDTVRAGLVPTAELAPVDSLWLERHRGGIERRLQITMDEAGYPREARRRLLQGEARVAFTIRRDGSVADVRVTASSGHAVLDRQAVDVVRRTAPFPRPPVDQEVEIPFRYRLYLL